MTSEAARPDAEPSDALGRTRAYLDARLAYEIDVLDAAAALAAGEAIVVDTRKRASWDHGHVPGAVHLPSGTAPDDVAGLIPPGARVVLYGWGPGCNGATRAAAELAAMGYDVREMIGGFEYWCRTGLTVETATGPRRMPPDPLVTAEGSGDVGEPVPGHGPTTPLG